MNIKQKMNVEIIDYGIPGQGVAKTEEGIIFVPNSAIGDKLCVTITETKKSYNTAKVIKVIEPSVDRINPACEIFFKCGSCDMLHINRNKHQQIKSEYVKTCFKKYAKQDISIAKYVSGKQFNYRSKIQLPIGKIDDKIIVGYYLEKSHTIIDCNNCILQNVIFSPIIKTFLNWANKNAVTVYNESKFEGTLRHIVLRKIGNTVSIVIVINANTLPKADLLINDLSALKIPFTLHYNINKSKTNVIIGDSMTLLSGTDNIVTQVLDKTIEVNPFSFMQINDEIRDHLYTAVVEEVKSAQAPIIIDTYSGIGITSNILAPYANVVYGIEIVPQAIANANNNAKLNNNKNIINLCGDTAKLLPKLLNKLKNGNITPVLSNDNINSNLEQPITEAKLDIDTAKNLATNSMNDSIENSQLDLVQKINDNAKTILILDPPRKGCDPTVIESILSAKPDKIVYISCNPATLSRDIALLSTNYNMTKISLFDMFPNTSHIESLALLEIIK